MQISSSVMVEKGGLVNQMDYGGESELVNKIGYSGKSKLVNKRGYGRERWVSQ